MARNNFIQSLSQTKKDNQKGKIVILSGMSGSGKSFIANMLAEDFNFMQIKKYITRPFRMEEIQATMHSKNARRKGSM